MPRGNGRSCSWLLSWAILQGSHARVSITSWAHLALQNAKRRELNLRSTSMERLSAYSGVRGWEWTNVLKIASGSLFYSHWILSVWVTLPSVRTVPRLYPDVELRPLPEFHQNQIKLPCKTLVCVADSAKDCSGPGDLCCSNTNNFKWNFWSFMIFFEATPTSGDFSFARPPHVANQAHVSQKNGSWAVCTRITSVGVGVSWGAVCVCIRERRDGGYFWRVYLDFVFC